MVDILEIGCACLQGSYIPSFMRVAAVFGYNSIAILVGCALLVWGYIKKDRALKRHGWILLISLVSMGTIVLLLKQTVQLPRPSISARLSFPSGDTGTAFVLAASLARIAPGWSVLFYLLAALAGISRLYLRLHFVTDVLAGAAIGVLTVWLVAAKLGAKTLACRSSRFVYGGYFCLMAAVAPVLAFFYAFERQVSAHRIAYGHEPVPQRSGITPFNRQKTPVSVSPPSSPAAPPTSSPPSGHNLVFVATVLDENSQHLFFDAGTHTREFICQSTETLINGVSVRRIFFEHGWHRYQVSVSRNTFAKGENRIDFSFPIMPKSWFASDIGTTKSYWESPEISSVYLANSAEARR